MPAMHDVQLDRLRLVERAVRLLLVDRRQRTDKERSVVGDAAARAQLHEMLAQAAIRRDVDRHPNVCGIDGLDFLDGDAGS